MRDGEGANENAHILYLSYQKGQRASRSLSFLIGVISKSPAVAFQLLSLEGLRPVILL